MPLDGEPVSQAGVVIYIKSWCPHCHRALDLLEDKGVLPEIIDVEDAPARLVEMIEKSAGRTTVPQIFIGERHIGGNDDLQALDRQGQLEPLLA